MNPNQFALEWAAAWNRRDIEAVVAHFADDVQFTSPTALAVTGSAAVLGKSALRDYWRTAMARIDALTFTLTRVLWDAAQRELAIIYVAEINGSARSVSENLIFNEQDLVARAEVFHGAPIATT
ncbi:MAG TPA: nuclear transport factor 2 family protein [Steroidobacteraceae bacterium]